MSWGVPVADIPSSGRGVDGIGMVPWPVMAPLGLSIVTGDRSQSEPRRSPDPRVGGGDGVARPVEGIGGEQSLVVLFLAGGLNTGELHRSVGFPVPGLPLDPARSILRVWLELARRLAAERHLELTMRVVCSSEADLAWYRGEVQRACERAMDVELLLDPRTHRGVAGVVADVTSDLPPWARVLVVEMSTLPPRSLGPLLDAAGAGDRDGVAVVGTSLDQRPAGTILLRRRMLEAVPRLGYFDLKEQLIPQLLSRGDRVLGAALGETSVRMMDRRNYLRAVRIWQSRSGLVAGGSSPQILGHSIVCPGATLHPEATVVDSVVLPGARLGPKAVVARSVIGPLMVIPESAVIVDSVLADASLPSRGLAVSDARPDAAASPSRVAAGWSF
jgi:hypothetical protein